MNKTMTQDRIAMELGKPRTTIADWLTKNDGSVNGSKDHRKKVTPETVTEVVEALADGKTQEEGE